jgi:choline dehydrogenase-like flavoprotein
VAIRGRDVRADVRRTADVVVVGSGAGGAVAAARLAEAGLEVVIVESGGLWTSADFDEREAHLTERLYAEQALRATEDLAVTLFQGDAVGGSTTVNWMIMLRPDAPVRDEWARRFGIAQMTDGAFDRALDRVWDEVHARPSRRRALGQQRAPARRRRGPSGGAPAAPRSTRAAACAPASAASAAATTPSRARS